jgi:ferredoxin
MDGHVWTVAVSDECIGSGSCTGIAPDRFQLGTDGRSRPRSAQVPADPRLLDAAACCPAEAISVVDPATGRPVEA